VDRFVVAAGRHCRAYLGGGLFGWIERPHPPPVRRHHQIAASGKKPELHSDREITYGIPRN
jgi:hypothetical protein